MSAEPLPRRRNLHLMRWMFVLIVATFAWSGWRVYAFRSAIAQAKALGWTVFYADPAVEIRADWRNAFKKETWTDGVRSLNIPGGRECMENIAIVHRLNPRKLRVDKAGGIRDLSAFGSLRRLEALLLSEAVELDNIDALGRLPALRALGITGSRELADFAVLSRLQRLVSVTLRDCPKLKNVDMLGSIRTLRLVQLEGCAELADVRALLRIPAPDGIHLGDCVRLTDEQVQELRSAFPNAFITGP